MFIQPNQDIQYRASSSFSFNKLVDLTRLFRWNEQHLHLWDIGTVEPCYNKVPWDREMSLLYPNFAISGNLLYQTYRLITAYLLLRVNFNKIMHAR